VRFRPQEDARIILRRGFPFFIVILWLLQMTVCEYLRIFTVKPDLLLVSVFISSLAFKRNTALSFSILAGILKDIPSSHQFGINTFLFALWCLLIIRLSKKITVDTYLIRALIVIILSFCGNIISRFILLFLGNFIPWGVFLRVSIFEALYTAAVLPIALRVFKPLLPSGGL